MQLDDYLAAGDLIEQDLRSSIEKVTVGTAADLEQIETLAQRGPGLFVVFDTFVPIQEGDNLGIEVETEQTWLVVVAVRNVSDVRTGKGARQECGRLVMKVMRRLQGRLIDKSLTRLRLARPPRAVYLNGFMYVPVAFTTKVKVTGDAVISANHRSTS